MSDDARAYTGTAEGQEPVGIDAELARHLQNKCEELFEEFEIRDTFPPGALSEARIRTDGVHEEIEDEFEHRKDLRGLMTWTTDPVDAQDSDDALSIRENGETYTLWVHIADVTHYVHPGSEMWAKAVKRGNAVYLSAYTIHMLPPALAETTCSLVPEEDRLAHTVETEIKEDTLSFGSTDIYKSVIHSSERLTYTRYENRLEGPDLPLHEENTLVFGLANQLHKQRRGDGSLVLNPSRDHAHTVIEGCVLEANKAATHELIRNHGVGAMYRAHLQPTPGQWDEMLREITELDGVSIQSTSWDEPQRAVNDALESVDSRMLNKIQRVVLRIMPRAKYMNDPLGSHYALNFDVCGHFTSPIRRLSNLINHWVVHENDVPEDLVELCDRASDRQKDAETAERPYKQFLQKVSLDPYAINNRGIATVDDDGEVIDRNDLPPQE